MANLHLELERGGRADALLNNDIYKESVGKVRQGIHDAWAAAPLRDVEGQTNLRLMLKLLDDLEKNIKQVAQTGKMASIQIETENKVKEAARRAMKGLGSLVGK